MWQPPAPARRLSAGGARPPRLSAPSGRGLNLGRRNPLAGRDHCLKQRASGVNNRCICVYYCIFPRRGHDRPSMQSRAPDHLSSHASPSPLEAREGVGSTGLSFSIVTPSYKQLAWLKLCTASVADQRGVKFEHIIQDAFSGPELTEWVLANTKAALSVEHDSGMYDAINRGFAKASGDILAWLNCDEQYLPDALAKVRAFFEANPEVEVVFGDALLVAENGEPLSYRKAILPSSAHVRLSHLNTLSCATFVRRSVLERGLVLESQWKAIGDAVWIEAMLRADVPMAVLNVPLAAFTITTSNLGQSELALQESKRWKMQTTSLALRLMTPAIALIHRLKKWWAGAYFMRSINTALYTSASPTRRVQQRTENLCFRWIRRDPEERRG